MIRTRQLTKRFGRVVAVDGVDLDIADVGVVGFLGPNGAGKTTTMRMLTGSLAQTSGTAEVCGVDVFEEPVRAKERVGYLPETPPLYPQLTVGETLRFVAEIRGISRSDRLRQVGQAMEEVGLQGWESRLVGGLSRGFRQRVGLAMALVHRPQLLILDEPTAGLDPAQLVPIRALIAQLGRDRLVVLSTHILSEVEVLCDRVVLLHRGRIAGDGTVASLAQQSGQGPWLELVVGTEEDLSSQLSELADLSAVRRLGPSRYRLEGGPELADQAARAASAGSWGVRALHPRAPSLEQVFVDLVSRP